MVEKNVGFLWCIYALEQSKATERKEKFREKKTQHNV